LDLQVDDIQNMKADEKQSIVDYLTIPNRAVYVSSKQTDTTFFKLINQFRVTRGLNILKHSIRLDTLCNIVIRKNAEAVQMKHYDKFPELKSVYDLFGVENLVYSALLTYDINSVSKKIDLNDFLQSWVSSPGHLKNLLRPFEVGTAKVMLKIIVKKKAYIVDVHGIFETDYIYSIRELDEKFKKLNSELIHRTLKH
jgi:uncharacterized protein YkwD